MIQMLACNATANADLCESHHSAKIAKKLDPNQGPSLGKKHHALVQPLNVERYQYKALHKLAF